MIITKDIPNSRWSLRPDIKTLGAHGETTLFDVAVSHPLSTGILANVLWLPNPLSVLNAARTANISQFRPLVSKRDRFTGPWR